MTVRGVRIRPWSRLAGVIAIALVVSPFVVGCNDPPPETPTPPDLLVPPESIASGLDEDAIEPGLGRPDAWYDAYHSYMSPEMRRDYLATPEEQRFERFGLHLLDYQLREDLLREHEDVLASDDKDLFRRLPSAEACRRFVRERATPRRRPIEPPGDSIGPVSTR